MIRASPFTEEETRVCKDWINVPQINNIREDTGLANEKHYVADTAGWEGDQDGSVHSSGRDGESEQVEGRVGGREAGCSESPGVYTWNVDPPGENGRTRRPSVQRTGGWAQGEG